VSNTELKSQIEVAASLAAGVVVSGRDLAPRHSLPRKELPMQAGFDLSSNWLACILQMAILLSVAALLCLPCLLVGIPLGTDSPTHVAYQYHFNRQLWSGDIYPRWLMEANKGFGSPIFVIQYPFPYFVTGLLSHVLSFTSSPTRESRELGVYCFIMLAAAGLSAWAWFRTRFGPTASTIAAAVYIGLPHILGHVLYARAAIGELATFVWMPLLFLLCDRAQGLRFEIVSAMGVVFALLLLSNILYAALFSPVFVLYAAVAKNRRWLPVLAGLLLGTCVAAVYLLPLVAYERMFDLRSFVTHHHLAQWHRNLLYVSASELYGNRIALPAMVVAACLALFVARYIWLGGARLVARLGMLLTLGLGVGMLIPDVGPALVRFSGLKMSGFESFADYSMFMLFAALFTLGLGFLAYCRVSGNRCDPRERLFLVVASGAFFLMLPCSAGIWRAIPRTDIIQFPWRLCAILSVAVAALFAAAVDHCLRHGCSGESRPSLQVLLLIALAVIGAGSIIWRVDTRLWPLSTPSLALNRWVDPMYVTYVPSPELVGFAQRLGTSPDSFRVVTTSVEQGVSAEFVSGRGVVTVTRTGPRTLLVSAECFEDARVQIGQLYFPLWKVLPRLPGDRPVLESSPDGLLQLSLPAGPHDFEIRFDGGAPERSGVLITLTSLMGIAGGFLFISLRSLTRKYGLAAERMSLPEVRS
jgi:hypothetical protein